MIYIREAHPSDGWQVPVNEREEIIYEQPTSEEERIVVASDCVKSMKIQWPMLLDNMQNATNLAYSAWPTRACLIGKDGKVLYLGKRGPQGSDPQGLAQWLAYLFPE